MELTNIIPGVSNLASVFGSTLALTARVQEIRAVGEQTVILLDTVDEINGQLDATKSLRKQKSRLLGSVEKKLVDDTIANTERVVGDVARLVEPCRVAMRIGRGGIDLGTRLMFVVRDSPKISERLHHLAMANNRLQTSLNLLLRLSAPRRTVPLRSQSDEQIPRTTPRQSYAESQFLIESRSRNLRLRARHYSISSLRTGNVDRLHAISEGSREMVERRAHCPDPDPICCQLPITPHTERDDALADSICRRSWSSSSHSRHHDDSYEIPGSYHSGRRLDSVDAPSLTSSSGSIHVPHKRLVELPAFEKFTPSARQSLGGERNPELRSVAADPLLASSWKRTLDEPQTGYDDHVHPYNFQPISRQTKESVYVILSDADSMHPNPLFQNMVKVEVGRDGRAYQELSSEKWVEAAAGRDRTVRHSVDSEAEIIEEVLHSDSFNGLESATTRSVLFIEQDPQSAPELVPSIASLSQEAVLRERMKRRLLVKDPLTGQDIPVLSDLGNPLRDLSGMPTQFDGDEGLLSRVHDLREAPSPMAAPKIETPSSHGEPGGAVTTKRMSLGRTRSQKWEEAQLAKLQQLPRSA